MPNTEFIPDYPCISPLLIPVLILELGRTAGHTPGLPHHLPLTDAEKFEKKNSVIGCLAMIGLRIPHA